jgi:hypothetical protein
VRRRRADSSLRSWSAVRAARLSVVLVVVLVACGLAVGAPAHGAPGRQTGAVGASLVVTQLPPGTAAERSFAPGSGLLSADWGPGARLVLVRDGKLQRVLTKDFASAADPEVSFDGKRILFAGQKKAGDRWAIYEMNVDGTGLRQVVAASDDLRQPVYLPTVYVIIADPTKGTAPREQIGYVRHFDAYANETGVGRASAIFSVQTDGSAPWRLTHNLSADQDPAVLLDGRILYSSWRRATFRRGASGRVVLLGVNADGSDPAVFAADEGGRVKRMPAVMPNRLVVFVEPEPAEWDGAGPLASVSLRRNLHSHRRITAAGAGLFHSPLATPDGRLLAARRPPDGKGTHAIVQVDPTSGRVTPFFDDPAFHDMQPRALAPRPLPDGRSTALKDPDEEAYNAKEAAKAGTSEGHPAPAATIPHGEFYGLDVYLNDLGHELPPGTVRRVRLVEGLPLARSHASSAGALPMASRRLIGEAAVEQDGSYHVHLPAELPVQLQILDQDGLALRTSGWVWVRYRGRQGCIGCHEDPERTPPSRFVDALRKPGARFLLPPEQRRSVDFRSDIAPIVEARCSACHGEGKRVRLDGGLTAKDASDRFSRAYATLMSGLDTAVTGLGEVVGRYVHPYRARTSPVVWHILGRNTARPWDGTAAQAKVAPMPAGVGLDADERRLFIEWIDMGALWDASLGREAVPASGGGGK